jgi:hypothetical protein
MYDLKAAPHWMFLTVTVLFAPFLTVTASWQKKLAEASMSSVGGDVQLFAYLTAACGIGVAFSWARSCIRSSPLDSPPWG